MANKDKLPTPSEQNPPQHPIHEAEERTFKQTPVPRPQEKKDK